MNPIAPMQDTVPSLDLFLVNSTTSFSSSWSLECLWSDADRFIKCCMREMHSKCAANYPWPRSSSGGLKPGAHGIGGIQAPGGRVQLLQEAVCRHWSTCLPEASL